MLLKIWSTVDDECCTIAGILLAQHLQDASFIGIFFCEDKVTAPTWQAVLQEGI